MGDGNDVSVSLGLEDLVDGTNPGAQVRETSDEDPRQGTDRDRDRDRDAGAEDDCPFSSEQQAWLEDRMQEIALETILEAADDGVLDVDLALDIGGDADVEDALGEQLLGDVVDADEPGECPDCGADLKSGIIGHEEPICPNCNPPNTDRDRDTPMPDQTPTEVHEEWTAGDDVGVRPARVQILRHALIEYADVEPPRQRGKIREWLTDERAEEIAGKLEAAANGDDPDAEDSDDEGPDESDATEEADVPAPGPAPAEAVGEDDAGDADEE